jgi:hypothetical protein
MQGRQLRSRVVNFVAKQTGRCTYTAEPGTQVHGLAARCTARQVGVQADRQCVQLGKQVYAQTDRRPAKQADFQLGRQV